MKQIAIIKPENARTLAKALEIPYNVLASRSELGVELDLNRPHPEILVARDSRVMETLHLDNLSYITERVLTEI